MLVDGVCQPVEQFGQSLYQKMIDEIMQLMRRTRLYELLSEKML